MALCLSQASPLPRLDIVDCEMDLAVPLGQSRKTPATGECKGHRRLLAQTMRGIGHEGGTVMPALDGVSDVGHLQNEHHP